MPAAFATATRCIVWFVDPPVASTPTMAFTTDFSLTTRPSGV